MDNKRPKRRKDKYNPYTLHTEKGKYYISFTDADNCIQKVLISKKIFDSFNKFELEDISWMNEYDRHYEHSEIYESTLHERGAINVECMEEYLDNTQDMENLPEVQKRRLKKYYFEEKTFDEIAFEEGCTYQSIQRSVYRAVKKIKNILKNS